VLGNFRIDYFGADRFEPPERAFLVALNQARITGGIGRDDRREPTFDASSPCGLHSASSVADDPTSTCAWRALSKDGDTSEARRGRATG